MTVECISCRNDVGDDLECSFCGEIQALTPGITREMVRAVRKHECLVYGHEWEIFKTVDKPIAVWCQRCGLDSKLKRCNCGKH